MDNIYLGVAVVLICTAGYYFSYVKQKRDQYTIAVALLVLCGLILRVYTSCDPFLHFWDERYHALVAKNLAHHFLTPTLYDNPVLPYSFKSWEYNHIWVHKQPVTLWLMAVSFKIFGVHAFVARIPSIVMSTVGIKLVYDIGNRFYAKEVGYVAAFLFSINGLIIELAAGRVATDHVDIAFMFFVLLAVWCGVKSSDNKRALWIWASGVFMGAAVLCKWVPALIVVPVNLMLLLGTERSKRDVARQIIFPLIGAAVVVLP